MTIDTLRLFRFFCSGSFVEEHFLPFLCCSSCFTLFSFLPQEHSYVVMFIYEHWLNSSQPISKSPRISSLARDSSRPTDLRLWLSTMSCLVWVFNNCAIFMTATMEVVVAFPKNRVIIAIIVQYLTRSYS